MKPTVSSYLAAIALCFLTSVAGSAATTGSAESITLDSSVMIVEAADAPAPIQAATEDLRNDFEKVFGVKPKLGSGNETTGTKIFIDVRPADGAEPETYSISKMTATLNGGKLTSVIGISLTGHDLRGTIYAIYQFSHRVLGVDPMYYWTDQEPVRRLTIQVPSDVFKTYPAPVFKYRGFFINDEDLLTGWAPGEKRDRTGISLDVWNRIYETILRLKGNMVAPGTWIFPDELQVRLASKRGLIITQHHAIPLGMNVARWPENVPYNYNAHPEILENAWKNAVNSYLPDQEVLWTVGLRGLSDVSYASMDPSVRDNNKALGATITKAVADEMSIVRAVRPNAQFLTSLWQEGAQLMKSGDLTIPKEVTEVWADDGYGYIQDNGAVSAGQGTYDHVAMMNGRANQLGEMVPVERSLSELGRYIKADATAYYLVNTSDIRPVTMSTKLVMDVVANGLPQGGADQFYKEWTTQQFGDKASAAVTEVYKDFFNAPAQWSFTRPNTPPSKPREYGDQLYQTEARQLMLTYMLDWPLYSIPGQAPKWTAPRKFGTWFAGNVDAKELMHRTITQNLKECADAQPRWDAVWKKAVDAEPLVLPERKPFYRMAVLTMIATNRDGNRALYLISKAIDDAEKGNTAEAEQETNQAKAAIDEILQFQHESEYGKWKNFYRGDWLAGVWRTRQMLDVFANYLTDPQTHLAPPVLWDGWEAYYQIMHYEGNRSVDVK